MASRCDSEHVNASVVGLLLAAGAGRRMGGPKALVTGVDGLPWLVSTARRLRRAGCNPVRVVLGAGAADAAEALAAGGDVAVGAVVAADWAEGMGASLRAGLAGLEVAAPDATAALVHLVDLPDVGADVLQRLVTTPAAARTDVLARAAYAGVPGHPVLVGRDHWAGLAGCVRGDRGGRDYLAVRAVDLVECGDLATGADVDEPPAVRGHGADG